MPEFEIVPLQEAQARTAFVGRRGRIIREYVDYIQQVGPKQAGRLRAVCGEKITTVRRRSGQASRVLEANPVIKRAELAEHQEARASGRRFRRDPAGYLAKLEAEWVKLTLPP